MATQSTIAHYRITSKLGEGGMGAVYRATDTKLNRDVAIKVLPDSFAFDRDRLARFSREAHVLASLNHPNIAAIYGVEDRALVMELVEGETLAGPLAVDAALQLINHLIDALEYAHEKGVVHRDLKPANIKITPEGRLKVLDFGLAKAMATDEPVANPSVSPTVTLRATMAGQIMGTAAYMAPEQARGQAVDKRADIWAFGVVVYELLTGRPLFEADNISDILVQVLSKEVDLSAVPPRFHALLRKCLERDPRKRLRDIGDARAMLDAPVIAAVAPARSARLPWFVAAAALLAMCVIGAMSWLSRRPAPSEAPPLIHFTVDVPSEGLFASVSPDGQWLASASSRALFVRSLDDIAWRRLPGTEGATMYFWAEDSSALAFFSEGRLRSVSLDGSNLRNLAPWPNPSGGGAWRGGSDGTILFASDDSFRVLDLQSGSERSLGKNPGGGRISGLAFLPEGDGFVYSSGFPAPRLMQSSLSSTGQPKQLGVQSPRNVKFGQDPHTGQWYLFYIADDNYTLLARQIHPRDGTLMGRQRQVLTGISSRADAGAGFAVARNGVIVWLKTRHSVPVWRLRRYDRAGNVTATIGDPAAISGMSLSPDETRAAIVQGFPNAKIVLYNLQTGAVTPLSGAPGSHRNPLWAPDGETLYYSSANGNIQQIIRQEPSGGSVPEVIYQETGPSELVIQDVTPDGRTLILIRLGGPPVLLRLDVTSSASQRKPEVIPDVLPASVVRLSRDGRVLWLADTNADISALPYPPNGESPKRASASNGPIFHFVSRDGARFYQFMNNMLHAQPILPGMRLGERTAMFPVVAPRRAFSNFGAETRDGQFLIVSTDAVEEFQTHVLSDWTKLLKQ